MQACIDAAAKAGAGAMAYFPKGSYRLARTIEISGRDFYIGGAGYQTMFTWAGPVVNATPGAARNATAEKLAVMWRVWARVVLSFCHAIVVHLRSFARSSLSQSERSRAVCAEQ